MFNIQEERRNKSFLKIFYGNKSGRVKKLTTFYYTTCSNQV